MTGEEILKAFFVMLYKHYQLTIEDFEDTVIIDDIDTIVSILNGDIVLQGKNNICALLENFTKANVGQDYLENVYVGATAIHSIDFTTNGFQKRHRPFSYADPEFGFLSCKRLLNILPLNSLHNHATDFKVLLDYISTAILNSDDQSVTNVLDHITNQTVHIGLLVEWIMNNADPLQTYSYVYYKKLLSGEIIDLDTSLRYTLAHGATTTFDPSIIYQQYFEVFDIVNELNYAEDFITRYLKLYHIIEYLVYRVELVKVEKKARLNRTFIREIHKLAGHKNGEMALLLRCLKEVFGNEIKADYFNLGPLAQDQCDFLELYWGIEYNSGTLEIKSMKLETIANLIYGIRNSIVHNKESEFHLTTTNPSEYSIVIPVIQRFMQKLEKIVLDKISGNVLELRYNSPNIQLY